MATMSVVDDALTMGGQNAFIDPARKGSVIRTSAELDLSDQELSGTPGYYPNGHQIPTEEELRSLRRVAGKMPMTTYLLCAVEFAERASYYGCNQVYKNFIRGKLPKGGNGAGAPKRGTQDSAGALGKGGVVASAMTDAFKFMAYALPIFGGWIADTRLGRFKTICIGVAICGIAHVVMVISAIPSVLQSGHAIGPFAFSLYSLAIGAALFKPNISPTILDQNPHKRPHVVALDSGERVIIDPESTTESVMLWFYLLVNIGGFFGVPTAYMAKYIGFWSSYLLPGIVYFLLPPLLWYIYPRLQKMPPGGSDLGNVFKVLGLCIKKGGVTKIGRKGFWEAAKPSNLRASGDNRVVPWNDQFVNDVRRTFQACAIFMFYPIAVINDGGLGAAANLQSASLVSNGVPNDVLDNLNPLAIIVFIPILNHLIYPFLRNRRIHFGPIARITFGFLLSSVGSIGWAAIQASVYKKSPCGNQASTCEDADGNALVAPISLWVYAVPTVVTALSECFMNITAFGLAYSRSPKNMKGLVMAINLFTTAIASAISLATADAIQDPNLTWAFAGPSIIGFVMAWIFWFTFKHLNNEEFVINTEAADEMGGASGSTAHDSEIGYDGDVKKSTIDITDNKAFGH